MAVVLEDLPVDAGSTYRFSMEMFHALLDVDGEPDLDEDGNYQEGDPYDFDGCTGVMHVRAKAIAGDILVEISSDDDAITFDANTVSYVLTDEQTDVMGWDEDLEKFRAFCYYDLEATYLSTDRSRLFQGRFAMKGSVTRD